MKKVDFHLFYMLVEFYSLKYCYESIEKSLMSHLMLNDHLFCG